MIINKGLYSAVARSMAGRYSVYLCNLVSLMILARMFSPNVYGVIASVFVVYIFFKLFSEAGLGPAVINLDSFDSKERDGVFSVTLLLGIALGSAFLAMSDVIVANDEEFGFMAGDIACGLDKARELATSSAAIVVYKMGAEGAVTFANGQELRTGIFPVDAVKPTGAGDSFMAGFLAALSKDHLMKDAVLRGSACASIVVAQPGCAPAMPNTAELEAFLASHPGPTTS